MMTKLRGILTFLLLFLTLAACQQQPQEEAVQTEPTATMTQPLQPLTENFNRIP